NGPLNRGGAAILRQKRRVHIEEAVLRDRKQLGGKNFSVGDNDPGIRSQIRHLAEDFANSRRLRERQFEVIRQTGDRRRMQLQATPRTLVRLGHDERDLVHACERAKRRNSEVGSTEKDDAQSLSSRAKRGSFSFLRRGSFAVFAAQDDISLRRRRQMRSRRRGRRRLCRVLAVGGGRLILQRERRGGRALRLIALVLAFGAFARLRSWTGHSIGRGRL